MRPTKKGKSETNTFPLQDNSLVASPANNLVAFPANSLSTLDNSSPDNSLEASQDNSLAASPDNSPESSPDNSLHNRWLLFSLFQLNLLPVLSSLLLPRLLHRYMSAEAKVSCIVDNSKAKMTITNGKEWN